MVVARGGANPPVLPPLVSSSAWLAELQRRAPALASPDLLRRVGGTLAAIALIRVGAFVPLPGAEGGLALPAAAAGASLEAAFGGEGGAVGAVGVLALGIGPAVNASWLLAALSLNVGGNPFRRAVNELRRSGREGDAELKLWANLLTMALALLAGWRTAVACVPQGFVAAATLSLAAGAVSLRYIADWMEDGGLGDGMSLMICVSVLTGYSGSLARCAAAASATAAPPAAVAAAAAAGLLLVVAGMYVTLLEVRLPLVVHRQGRAPRSARRPSLAAASSPVAAARAGGDLPMRLAPGGMSPLLIASLFYHIAPSTVGLVYGPAAAALADFLCRPVAGPACMAALVVALEVAGAARSEAPKEMADWMASVRRGRDEERGRGWARRARARQPPPSSAGRHRPRRRPPG